LPALGVMKILIKLGANVNAKETLTQRSPLHEASMNNQIKVVKLLIENGANINIKDCFGYTPLHCAILKSNIEIMNILILNGSDPHTKSNAGRTPLQEALLIGNKEAISLLSVSKLVSSRNMRGMTLQAQLNVSPDFSYNEV
jgi:ankyrin repeat protein